MEAGEGAEEAGAVVVAGASTQMTGVNTVVLVGVDQSR